MSLYEILELAKQYPLGLVVGIVILLKCIEISPITINPLEWLLGQLFQGLKYLGNIINSGLQENNNKKFDEIGERMQTMEDSINQVEHTADLNRIKDIRWSILDFANSEPRRNHDREDFDHIFDIYEEYETLLEKHSLENGKTNRAIKKIDRIYQERDNDPDF